jgi:hypothetical protein
MRAVVIGAHRRREDIGDDAAAIAVSDLFLSGVELAPDQPASDRELLLRVARIRAALLDRATFVAIRYGFVVANDGDAFAKCAPHVDWWRRLLDAHVNDVEMTLKIAAAAPQPRPRREEHASGAEYLRALHRATQAASVDDEFRSAVETSLVPLARAHRWQHRDNASLELALLVARDRVAEVNAAGSALKSFDVPFLLSGPWPLEVFAQEEQP